MSDINDYFDKDFDSKQTTSSKSEASIQKVKSATTSNNSKIRSTRISSLDSEDNTIRDTPKSQLDDFLIENENLKPDLAIRCPTCDAYLQLDELKDHKEFHDALVFFGLNELPKNEDVLIEKRKALLKQASNKLIRKSKDLETSKAKEWNVKVKQINDNYEIIKSYLNNTFEAIRQIKNSSFKLDVQGESQIMSNESIIAISSCLTQNKTHRLNMEDSSVVIDRFGENKNLTYIGTFDGYDGDVASNKCSAHLHLALVHKLCQSSINIDEYLKETYPDDEINRLEKFTEIPDEIELRQESGENFKGEKPPKSKCKSKNYDADYFGLANSKNTYIESKYSKEYRNSFKYAYNQMEKLLTRGRDEVSKSRWSGATACTCVIEHIPVGETNGKPECWIHIANCGNVEAIIVLFDKNLRSNLKNKTKSRKYKILTRLHTLNDCVQDRENLEKKGCRIVESSSGNFTIKGLYSFTRAIGFNGDKHIKAFLNPTPSFRSLKVEPNHACLIIATKGLWNVLTYEKVAEITNELFASYTKKFNDLNKNEIYTMRNLKNDTIEELSAKSSSSKALSQSVLSSSSEDEESSLFSLEKKSSNLNETNARKLNVYDTVDSPFYRLNSRPKTAPPTRVDYEHERFNSISNSNDERNSMNGRSQTTELDESYDDFAVTVKKYINNKDNILSTNRFKSNSDIFPSSKKNFIVNESHDLKVDIKELQSFDTMHNIQNSMNTMEISNNSMKVNDTDNERSNKSNEIKIIPTNYKSIQVNDYDLNTYNRNVMSNRQMALRLEFSQMLVENLVKCALIAGSTDNITVNCVLLNEYNGV